jgi:hypothetical protein
VAVPALTSQAFRAPGRVRQGQDPGAARLGQDLAPAPHRAGEAALHLSLEAELLPVLRAEVARVMAG